MAPIDPILARIGEIQKQLQLLGPQVGGMSPLEALGSPVLRGLLQGLQDDAQALPPPVRAWVSQIGRKAEGSVVSGATSELESGYRREVQATCLAVVAGRYPFTPDSPREVPLSDFGRLFAYGGVYDAFFSDHLAPLVDSSQSPWTWRQGLGSPSHDMLAQFEGAKRVREAFFRPGSQTPQAPFTVTIGISTPAPGGSSCRSTARSSTISMASSPEVGPARVRASPTRRSRISRVRGRLRDSRASGPGFG